MLGTCLNCNMARFVHTLSCGPPMKVWGLGRPPSADGTEEVINLDWNTAEIIFSKNMNHDLQGIPLPGRVLKDFRIRIVISSWVCEEIESRIWHRLASNKLQPLAQSFTASSTSSLAAMGRQPAQTNFFNKSIYEFISFNFQTNFLLFWAFEWSGFAATSPVLHLGELSIIMSIFLTGRECKVHCSQSLCLWWHGRFGEPNLIC